ncbi:hypothetical protein [Nocardia cyriacigeorgica]|uniref:hypothetical protein n=1 Tax=Nocardia cyriacigeorgica TaxID=135487 RepID=UPI0018944B14|nr:hypothetical protein [Nocardia cyriacigeorgica]MBF6456442.1 hypothetical protein [Nocardia cyriacigeorgica]MBF6479382.1 hypothetical protein [Nocardia cyriacigeorgica]MBF6551248.1 hypothetical protein [Nocardia cyriacigeorgica]
MLEFGEPVAQSFGPGVSDLVTGSEVAGFALIQEVVLAAGDLGDRLLLDGGDPLLSALR